MGLEQAGVDLLQGDVAAEGEAAPAPGDRFRLGGRLDRAQAPAPGVGEQLLAADPAVLEAGRAQYAPQVGGGEGVDVDLALQGVAVRLLGLGHGAAARPHQLAARRGRRSSRPASAPRPAGRRSGRARRRRRSRRRGAAPGGTRRRPARGRGCGAGPRGRRRGRSSRPRRAAPRPRSRPSRPPGRAPRRWSESRFSIPGEMSVAVSRSNHPELEQVEREVAGAGADLQPVAEAAPVQAPERLDQLQPHLLLAGVAEVDAPLGVVLVRRRVVVAGVDVLDVLGGGGRGGWHGSGTLRRKA